MRRAAFLLVLLAGLAGPAGPLGAQVSDPPRDKISGAVLSKKDFIERIRKRVIAIQKLHRQGKKDTAYRALALLNNEVDAQEAFLDGHFSFWWPDIVLGRLKYKDKAYAEAEAAVTPVVVGLQNGRYRQGSTRMEAMLILAKALTRQKKYEAADTIARALLREAPEDLKPKWRLEAESYLALAATWAGASDAGDLRRSLLDGYLDREGATVKTYLSYWRMDLDRRRQVDRYAPDLVRDARWVFDFIQTNPEAAKLNLTHLKGGLGRIFAENKDFKRAEPIFREQLKTLKPGSEKYYWAWQNLIGTHSRQKRYALVLSEAAPILAELEGRGPEYAKVTAVVLRTVGEAAKAMGEETLYHDSLQRAYIAMRQIASANDKDVIRIRRHLDLGQIDPDTFPFAEELGLTGKMSTLDLTLDGSPVVEAFFAGRYVALGRRLKALTRDPADPALAQLNLGLYHALLGEIGPAEEAIEAARKAARSAGGSQVPANSPLFDLYLVMTYSWARDWNVSLAQDPIARLMTRSDLTPGQARLLDILRFSVASAEAQEALGRQIYATRLADFDPREDSSPWGVLRAITMVNPIYEFAPRDADALVEKVTETVERAGNPRLATTMLAISVSNSRYGALADEQRFQALGFHLQALSRLVPPEHHWQAVARLNFAFALWDRGQLQEAGDLIVQAVRAYRKSPWHRKDVLAYMELQQALIANQSGNFDLAFTMLSQIWDSADAGTYGPDYMQAILTNYAFALSRIGRRQDAIATTQAALEDQRMLASMTPNDRAILMVAHGVLLRLDGRLDAAKEWMLRARDTLPSPDYRGGAPLEYVLTELAYVNYEREDYETAYSAIRRANDLHFTRVEQARASAGAEVARNRSQEKDLIVNEAVYGWLLAQKMQEEAQTDP